MKKKEINGVRLFIALVFIYGLYTLMYKQVIDEGLALIISSVGFFVFYEFITGK